MKPIEEQILQTYSALYGFNLRAFDKWLSTMKGYGIHEELTERRALAYEAIRAGNQDAALRHLEWMLLRWQWSVRAGVLIPLAGLGEKMNRGRKKDTISPVRSFIREFLRNCVDAKPRDVWAAIKDAPPKRCEVYGRACEGTAHILTSGKAGACTTNTSYRQFQNLVSEERRGLTPKRTRKNQGLARP